MGFEGSRGGCQPCTPLAAGSFMKGDPSGAPPWGDFKSGTAWGVQARIKDTLTLALGKRAY